MRRKKIYDPYAELLDKFNRNGVKYVIVGMSGINYYASSAKEVFTTHDFDIFVKPTIGNTTKAISILEKLGYNIFGADVEVKGKAIKILVKNKKTITASNAYGIVFELILAVSGYTFSQMAGDAATFSANNIPIKVGTLHKLLMSKKIAAREKDKLFLKRFEILLKDKNTI